jgi:hypothetical protein
MSQETSKRVFSAGRRGHSQRYTTRVPRYAADVPLLTSLLQSFGPMPTSPVIVRGNARFQVSSCVIG